jgi:ABC-2 type transport system ATP-binding protein
MRERLMLVLTMARKAKLYVFDEPFGGIDPAAREMILTTILQNYREDGAVLLATHLIADIEPILTRALFMKEGTIYIDENADDLRAARSMSIDKIFREEYRYDA